MMRFRFTTLAALLLLAVSSAYAQGTSAALTGTVMHQGQPLPGVTVTINSPALLGTRTTVTGESGGYNFPSLPPGEYTVTMDMQGMQTVTQRVRLSLAQTSRVDTVMGLSVLAEALTVTASAPAVLETTEIGTNFTSAEIANLPVGRAIRNTVLLAPGVNANGVNAQITISGAPSHDNTFLVNGVVVGENLRGQPHSLFIEDAIQETTVLTAGVSAEYGRFTGGVVSTLTKSGGNEFTGSFRESFTNPNWTEKTPFRSASGVPQADPVDNIDEVFEATLGGRIIRDRLWFFAAGRSAETAIQRSTAFTNIQFTNAFDEKRLEGKLTGQLTPRHSLVGSYLDIKNDEINNSFGAILDTSSIVPSRSLPNSLAAINYTGILGANFMLEAQYSEKEFAFVNSGGRFLDPVQGTWVLDLNRNTFFAAPVFCGVCTPEGRNNESWLAKGTYFLSTSGLGSHNFVLGLENFAETRIANNHQSGSDFTITNSGNIIQGSEVFPRFDPNTTIRWQPILANSEGTDFQTGSIFINDKWELNPHFSFNLGLRYDQNDGKDADGHLISDDSEISPRLGAIYDPRGDGRQRFSATLGRYVSKIADGNVGGSGQAAGNPAFISFTYRGPVINGPDATSLVPTHEALRQLFAWFDSVGGVDNKEFLIGTSVPGFATRFDESIASPSVDEITLGYGVQVGSNGFAKVDLISREWQNFYAQQLDMSTDQVVDPFGNRGDQGLTVNDDAETERDYRAVQLQTAWRPGRFNVGGGYTWSELEGNDEGEGAGTATIRNTPNSLVYPEYLDYPQRRPVGFLGQDQTHRARVWVGYDQPTPIGTINLSLLHNFDSGQTYSAVGTIDASGRIAGNSFTGVPVNPGYTLSQLGTTHAYFFSKRGEFRMDDAHSTDVAFTYNLPVWKINLFLHGDVLNVFNNDAVVDSRFIDTTVRTRRTGGAASGLIAFNPKTETPVECPQGAAAATCTSMGAHWQFGPQFGLPSRFEAYQLPLTYRFSAGLRF